MFHIWDLEKAFGKRKSRRELERWDSERDDNTKMGTDKGFGEGRRIMRRRAKESLPGVKRSERRSVEQ